MTVIPVQTTAVPAVEDLPLSSTGLEFLWLEITQQCNLHCFHC